MKLVQMNFKMTGPWGEELSAACADLAKSIAAEKGLVWKIWTENRDAGEAGGIYLFETFEDAQRYVAMHTTRLDSFGVDSVNVKIFDINEPLTAICHAPLHRT